jgi:hypothetical protein
MDFSSGQAEFSENMEKNRKDMKDYDAQITM